MSEELGGHEILQVLVVSDDRDGVHGAFKICTLCAESIENHEKLLVVDIIV
jgi:hypothetical protein